jgi:hypothetical protein
MIAIEDAIHCEHDGEYERIEDAFSELRRRAAVPWDSSPNQAPCTSWKTCGREYCLIEYDVSHKPWKLLRRVEVLKISAKGVSWVDGFEEAWASARKED